jgi:zona occludens toxin (predicted ATPase)
MGVLTGLEGNLMKNASVLKLVSAILLIFIGVFYLIWNGSFGTNEETAATTTTSSTVASTTTTIPSTTTTTPPTTTSTTFDLNATPVPGSCVVLEERFCQSGTVETLSGGGTSANFRLPAGTPVFTPYTGVVTYLFGETGKLFGVSVSKGDVQYSEAKDTFDIFSTVDQSIDGKDYIAKGEIVARVGESNFEAINKKFNVYNLFLSYVTDGISSATKDALWQPSK